MKKDTITRWIEWFLHLLPNASAWSFAITMLVLDMLNPTKHLPWCTVSFMSAGVEGVLDDLQKWYCFYGGREGNCIQRGSLKAKDLSVKMLYSHMFCTYSIIAISLLAICFHVARLVWKSKAAARVSPQLTADYLFKKQASKTVVMHSILYILSMTLPSIPGLLNAKGTPAPGKFRFYLILLHFDCADLQYGLTLDKPLLLLYLHRYCNAPLFAFDIHTFGWII
jgi:hypothetical protein